MWGERTQVVGLGVVCLMDDHGNAFDEYRRATVDQATRAVAVLRPLDGPLLTIAIHRPLILNYCCGSTNAWIIFSMCFWNWEVSFDWETLFIAVNFDVGQQIRRVIHDIGDRAVTGTIEVAEQ